MKLLILTLFVAISIIGIMPQEMTIPVGESGLDTLTTIRNMDAAGNYDVGYNENQLTGGASFYREKGYANGTREGSYGYTTRNGLIRIVTYVADQNGYRAELMTNEPGVGTANPANVVLTKETEPDPAALAQGSAASGAPQQSSVNQQRSSGIPQQSSEIPQENFGIPQQNSGIPQKNFQSTVVYSLGSDVMRDYVAGQVPKASAEVRIVSPFGQYQYVV